MIRPVSPLLGLAMLGLLSPLPASADDLLSYQPLEIRHICSPVALRDSPAGTETRAMAVGEAVRLQSITYGPDAALWFAVEGAASAQDQGYLPIGAVGHFCPTHGLGTAESGSALQSYLAPPNTCHLVLTKVETLEAVNSQTRRVPDFAPVMAAYRLTGGGYALSLGLVSREITDRVMASDLWGQSGISCQSGADFAEVLVYDGASFAESDKAAYADDAARLAGAQAILQRAMAEKAPEAMKAACDLGLGAACTAFAHQIHDAPDGPGRGPAVVTRYALLGCMAGDVDGCQMAVNRRDNTLELTRTTVLEGDDLHSGRLTTEISKLLCDAQDRFGCILQARGTAVERDPNMMEAASNYAAHVIACQGGITWACEGLRETFGAVTAARKAPLSPDESFALAGVQLGLCQRDAGSVERSVCLDAYRLYRNILRDGDPMALTAGQRATAVSALTEGCVAGSAQACVAQASLADHWPEPDRRAATRRAVALCTEAMDKPEICDGLGHILNPHFTEAQPALRSYYEQQAARCETPDGGGVDGGDVQDCHRALGSFVRLSVADGDSQPDLGEVEAMLHRACSLSNINGCQVLAGLYDDGIAVSGEVTIPGRRDPAARLEVLRMGCRSGHSAPGDTCRDLAEVMAETDDKESALYIRGEVCRRMMAGHADQDEWACYDGIKTAIAEQTQLGDALVWADYICRSDSVSLAPYACKLMGNILASGAVPGTDPGEAFFAYQRGCFHNRVFTTDGEACLIYGGLLREAVAKGETPEQPLVFAHREDGEEPVPQILLAEASRAFDMGCMDGIAAACTANETLLADWTAKDLPYDPHVCQVRTAEGRVTSEKPCRSFIFYQADGARKQSREQLPLYVYAWPDGDRSVTYIADGTWRLNEVPTDYPSREGKTTCWKNPVSTRSFCVTPAG